MKKMLNVLIVALFLLAVCSPTAALPTLLGSWSLHRYQPMQRHGAATACTATALYLHGGHNVYDPESEMAGLWRFDPSTSKWTQALVDGDVTNRYDHSLAVVDTGVFAVHGKRLRSILTDGYVYDTVQTGWLPLTFGKVQPHGRRGMSTVSRPDGFYMFFGRSTNAFLNGVWYFSALNYTWQRVVPNGEGPLPVPPPRIHSCCAHDASRDVIVCFGGKSPEGALNDVWEFSVSTRSWAEVVPVTTVVPPASHSAVCAVVAGKFSVLLGFDDEVVSLTAHSVLDLATHAWTQMPPLTINSGSGCAIGDVLYVNGVKHSNDTTTMADPTNSLWSINLTSLVFRKIITSNKEPPAFVSAAHIRVGWRMYMIWGGAAGGSINHRVWYYSMQHDHWKIIGDTWDNGQLRQGRIGAVAVERGGFVIVFGGYTYGQRGERIYSNELDKLDVGNNRFVWGRIEPWNGDIPPRRAHAAAVRWRNDVFYVFGGEGDDGNALGDLWMFDQVSLGWRNISMPGPWPGPRIGMSLHNDDWRYILLIGGSPGAKERWKLDFATGNRVQARWEFMPVVPPEGLHHRLFGRVFAADFNTGKTWMTCGGTSDDGIAYYGAGHQCFLWDAETGQVSLMPNGSGTLPLNMHSPAFASYKNRFYIFGGNFMGEGVMVDTCANAVQYFTVPTESVCADPKSEHCTYCSPGTFFEEGVPCIASPPGTINHWPGGNETSGEKEQPLSGRQTCKTGSSSDFEASTTTMLCTPCSEDSYQPLPGQPTCLPCPVGKFCPFHSVYYRNDTTTINISALDSNPPAFDPLPVPVPAFVTFGSLVVVVFGSIMIIYSLHRFAVRRWIQNYLSEKEEGHIRELYDFHDRTQDGIASNQLFLILTDLGVHNITDEETYTLVIDHDPIGQRIIFFKQVLSICVQLVQDGRLVFNLHGSWLMLEPPPPPKPLPWILDILARFSFKKFDHFKKQHSVTGTGEPLLVIKNHNGGVMTLMFWVMAGVQMGLLGVTYYYENISETRSSLPAVVAPNAAYSNIRVMVTTRGFGDSSQCVQPDGSCVDGTKINGTGFKSGIGNTETQSCQFTLPYWCKGTWTCSNCSCSIKSRVDFNFGADNDWFSSMTIAEVFASSGVPEDIPAISRRTVVPPPGQVFIGFPATEFHVEVTPTLMQGYVTTLDFHHVERTGYHVRFHDNQTIAGNSVYNYEFNHVFQIPISVILTETENVLVITRSRKTAFIDLFSIVVGGVSGVAGVFAWLTGRLDRFQKYRRQKKKISSLLDGLKNIMKSSKPSHVHLEKDLLSNTGTILGTLPSMENVEEEIELTPRSLANCIRPLLEANLTFKQAKAIHLSAKFMGRQRGKSEMKKQSQVSSELAKTS